MRVRPFENPSNIKPVYQQAFVLFFQSGNAKMCAHLLDCRQSFKGLVGYSPLCF